jgi:hypothetical protein
MNTEGWLAQGWRFATRAREADYALKPSLAALFAFLLREDCFACVLTAALALCPGPRYSRDFGSYLA